MRLALLFYTKPLQCFADRDVQNCQKSKRMFVRAIPGLWGFFWNGNDHAVLQIEGSATPWSGLVLGVYP